MRFAKPTSAGGNLVPPTPPSLPASDRPRCRAPRATAWCVVAAAIVLGSPPGAAALVPPLDVAEPAPRAETPGQAVGGFRGATALAADPDAQTRVENFQVEMSDGILLNTDVYYPSGGSGPWPALLYRTPYNIESDNIGALAEYGYACVCQDTRGRFGSEGTDQMFRDDGWGPDHRDGLETVQWILQQPWSDGRIGTLGGSARGITQNMLAGALPPGVLCMSVQVAPAGMYEHAVFPGGAFRQHDIEGWLTQQGSAYLIDSLYAHPNDDEWWSWLDTETRHPLENIPTFQYGGWFDLFLQGTIDSFTGLQYGGGAGAAGNQKLLIGPWTHGLGASQVGELEFPDAGFATPEALIGTSGEWFNHWIWDYPNGVMDKPPIAYYVMGDVDQPGAPGNEWRTSWEWPPPSQTVAYFLRSDGRLSLGPPAGPEDPESYAYDPQDPVPTLGGGNLSLPSGPYDQNPVLWREDVLVYQTDPLIAPVEVVGPIEVDLYVSSDRVDTDFTAKLCDVYPDGRAMLLCDGILRARHRESMESEEFLSPGEVYPVSIDLWETANVFDRGHRILVAVSSSNYPRFDANPNTGDPFMQQQTRLVATNTIYHDPEHPSRLLLPVTGEVPTGIEISDGRPEAGSAPAILFLTNHPNPFAESTQIRFGLASPGPARLTLCDAAGREVRQIATGWMEAGTHTLAVDARDGSGRRLPSGVLYCVLTAGNSRESRRVLSVR